METKFIITLNPHLTMQFVEMINAFPIIKKGDCYIIGAFTFQPDDFTTIEKLLHIIETEENPYNYNIDKSKLYQLSILLLKELKRKEVKIM